MQRITIRHKWALGDTILLTGLVRDLHRTYPEKYQIQVDTHFTNVWWNNPYVTRFEPGTQTLKVEVSWGEAIKSNSYAQYGNTKVMKHILAWYHYDFWKKTGIEVPVTDPKPDLHLTDEEKEKRISGRYWVILSGGKLDLTTKHWHAHRAQEVVDALAEKGIPCVQVGAVHSNHIHPPLKNCTNLLGKTENVRDLWNIIMHADGVICGVTGAMHIAAAFDKPCVVYAGGREEPWFEAYVNQYNAFGDTAKPVRVEHKFLHTIGQLICCDKQGCWKKRTIPLDPQDLTGKSYTLCRQPVRPETTHPVPRCQDLISSEQVISAVMSYYQDGTIPPIDLQQDKSNDLTEKNINSFEGPTVEVISVNKEHRKQIIKPILVREPSANIQLQKPYQKAHPLELTQSGVGTLQVNQNLLDHKILGGKFTVFVLCYGPYPQLAKRCLTSILNTVPSDRLDLRVAANAVAPETLDFLNTLPISKLYVNEQNCYKYPIMRQMFWDEDHPIKTNYILWFDDDTWVAHPNWLSDLAKTIIDNHAYGYRMYGNLMYHDLSIYKKKSVKPDTWFKEGKWYRGKPLRIKSGQQESVNGSIIDFAVGWCWALATEAIRAADIPDERLRHNGGDITIGEQIHQSGVMIKQWNKNKSLIACPSREQGGRRGYSEKFLWDIDL
jgi:ADP-heptose:LPS heptosyltransferase